MLDKINLFKHQKRTQKGKMTELQVCSQAKRKGTVPIVATSDMKTRRREFATLKDGVYKINGWDDTNK